MCVLMGFYAFGTGFQSFWSQSFARKDISCRMRNQMLDKIVTRQSQVILLLSSAYFIGIISSMCPQAFAKYF